MTAPDTSGIAGEPLGVGRGRGATPARRTYWIGYTVSPVKTLPPFIYIDGHKTVMGDGMTFSGDLLHRRARPRFPGRVLAVPAGPADGEAPVRARCQRRRAQASRAVHISTLSLPVETKNLPVFWLGAVEAAQSLDRVDRFYRAVSRSRLEARPRLGRGVHDASAAVVAWLERRVASQDPEDLRGNAAEWIAHHPIRRFGHGAGSHARGDRSSHVRQEAAEALGDVALPEAAPVLIALARSLTDPDARREAVEALGSRPEAGGDRRAGSDCPPGRRSRYPARSRGNARRLRGQARGQSS